VPPPRSLSRARNSHVNRRKLGKKKDLYRLFYIKGFEQFIFNPFNLIWI
jgi:hypothetical protein